jgi:hypothetical protein
MFFLIWILNRFPLENHYNQSNFIAPAAEKEALMP